MTDFLLANQAWVRLGCFSGVLIPVALGEPIGSGLGVDGVAIGLFCGLVETIPALGLDELAARLRQLDDCRLASRFEAFRDQHAKKQGARNGERVA